jgi:GT2 family glycosyltransferase
VLDRLYQLTPFVCDAAQRWVPVAGTAQVGQGRDTWQCSGDQPRFVLRKGLPMPGWQMLEVDVDHDQPCATVVVYLDTGSGFSENNRVFLPLKNGRVGKRLVHVPFGLKALRIHPVEGKGRFVIKRFRFVWLTPWFAQDRLSQRLANMHHRWKSLPKKQVLPTIRHSAREQNRHWRGYALWHYDATFNRLGMGQSYGLWLESQEEFAQQQLPDQSVRQGYQPVLSILLSVGSPRLDWLRECLASVLQQSYPHWQLCITVKKSLDSDIKALLEDCEGQDERVQIVHLAPADGACSLQNKALAMAQGPFVALLGENDCLATNALWCVADALQEQPLVGMVYSDEDAVSASGERCNPQFKPDWNPDLLLAQNYVQDLCFYRLDLVRRVGGFQEVVEGAQGYGMALRIGYELAADQIMHIPKVLYHRRQRAMLSSGAEVDVVREFIRKRESNAIVEPGEYPGTSRVIWPVPMAKPLVSMLIPTRDRIEILQPCVDAILARTDYQDFEVLILDNQSTCPDTLAYMETVSQRDSRVRVLRWNHAFNYSAINNYGARQARGDILALVNNDIEPIGSGWLTEMVRQVCRPDIGCVGAKLYYPNDTVQHGGVILGIGGVAGHAHKYFSRNASGYLGRLKVAHNLSAVTAACLLIRKSVFFEVDGLNEAHLTVAFNDVDLCIKVREAGYRNVWTPYAELYHHESVSRGADDNPRKRARAAAEVEYMRSTWGELLDKDPAYNLNLTLVHEDFSLR